MLKRNKFPPLPQPQPQPHSQTIPNPLQITPSPHHQMLSPNPSLNRLERKREESMGKSSSLNSKLVRKNVLRRKEEGVTKEEDINSDYYPQAQEGGRASKNERQALHGIMGSFEKAPSFESAPNLTVPDSEEKREQEETSTELSKQSDGGEPGKEVKFGGVVVEGTGRVTEGEGNMKRREKIRSPSILKNGTRNILNGSLVSSKQRERSCSVNSGKSRMERQKAASDNNTNKAIRQKYEAILSRLQAQAAPSAGRGNRFSGATYGSAQRQAVPSPYKYKDEIFPPVYSSLFEGKKGKLKIGEEIAWMRLPEVFRGRDLTLAKVFKANIEITRGIKSYAEDYFAGALNSMMGSPRLLEKIFEEQGVNPFGIYLLKIYQENGWKYIIIDDYIPVVKSSEGVVEPAFINVQSGSGEPVDIWPFLLEKAYANYYSRYEALQHGNTIDFAQEVAGSPSKRIQLRSDCSRPRERMSQEQTSKALERVRREMKAGETMAVGELLGDRGFVSLVYSIYNDTLYYNDPADGFRRKVIDFEYLMEICRAVHLIAPFKFQVCSSCTLRKGRGQAEGVVEGSVEPSKPSVRVFQMEAAGEVSVSLRQRERRLFHLRSDFGEYIWCRFMLLLKEEEHGFRWIDGEYSNRKAVSFSHHLEPGEYWLLVEPEWRTGSANELAVQVLGAREYGLERVVYREEERVVESGCMDLAQRFGELNQINKYICSYNYVTEKVGLIIENIINERVNGDVTVMRSIRGLKCKVQILPINREFYEQVGTEVRLREEIELDIPKGDHFTVVLKLRGGIDRKFFKSFDFGC